MAYTAHHGRTATVWVDTSAAGTFASSGTINLTQLQGLATWSLDRSRDFVDTTSFGDSSKTSVAGLGNASGDLTGINSTIGAGTLMFTNVFNSSTERALIVFPDFANNPTWAFSGKAFFADKTAGSVTTAVTLEIHFEAGPSGITWVPA